MYIDFRHHSTFLKARRTFPAAVPYLCFFIKLFGQKSRIFSVLLFQKPLPSLSFLPFFERSLSFLHSIVPDTSLIWQITVHVAKLQAKTDFLQAIFPALPARLREKNKTADTIYCRPWVVAWLILFTNQGWASLQYMQLLQSYTAFGE